MGRPAKVTDEERINVFRQFLREHYFLEYLTDKFPGPAADVWKSMSKCFNNKWTPRDCYREVTQDRRKIFTTAKTLENIKSNDSSDINKLAEDSLDQSHASNISCISTNGDSNEDWEAPGMSTFYLPVSKDLWDELYESPVQYNDRTYSILRRGSWTSLLAEKFFEFKAMPCAFVFTKARIYQTSNSAHYLVIIGRCKSKLCNNPFVGYMDRKPESFPCHLRVRTRDTFNELDTHANVKRPLRRHQRLKLGKESCQEGTGNVLKRKAAAYAKQGIRLPGHFPSQAVGRKCKSEYTQESLGVNPKDTLDVVRAIEIMRNDIRYPEYIHDVRRNKFYVFYSTPDQLHCYQRYIKICPGPIKISIDGTGSIVQSLKHLDGRKSGHIFFYAVVINYSGITIPVYQLLTECQSATILETWLTAWLRVQKVTKPNEVSCDCSRALMSAISGAFNRQTVRAYIDTMFFRATNNFLQKGRPTIYSYLRLDVAHFIKKITIWPCLVKIQLYKVRRFYLFCASLLIDCQSIDQFRRVFELTCVLALHESEDSIATVGYTPKQAQHELEKLIASRTLSQVLLVDKKIEEEIDLLELHREKVPDEGEEKDEDEDNWKDDWKPIQEWIDQIRLAAETVGHRGKDCNAFYARDFLNRFMKDVYEFPLWSAAALPGINKRSTTSYSEGYFNEKKHRVMGHNQGRPRVDIFLRQEHRDYEGGSAIFQDELLKECIEKSQPITSNLNETEPSLEPRRKKSKMEMHDPDAFTYDNWRNKGTIPRNLNANDLSVHDEMSYLSDDLETKEINDPPNEPPRIELNNLSAKAQIILPDINNVIDGIPETELMDAETEVNLHKENLSRLPISSSKPKKKETDGYYFTKQADIAYQNQNLTQSKNRTALLINGNKRNPITVNKIRYKLINSCPFDTIIEILATSGMDDQSYLEFVKASSSLSTTMKFLARFIEQGIAHSIYRERTVILIALFTERIKIPDGSVAKELIPHTLNMFGGTAEVWMKCFASIPSAFKTISCLDCGPHKLAVHTLFVQPRIIHDRGFEALQDAIIHEPPEALCDTCKTDDKWKATMVYNKHIFIEMDCRRSFKDSHKSCKLEQIPGTLQFNCCQYRLVGVIHWSNYHFIAYCKRGNNRWEERDDMCMSEKAQPISSNKIVMPNAAIYIRQEQQSTLIHSASDEPTRKETVGKLKNIEE